MQVQRKFKKNPFNFMVGKSGTDGCSAAHHTFRILPNFADSTPRFLHMVETNNMAVWHPHMNGNLALLTRLLTVEDLS